jgi:hypothetical protein
VRGGKGISVMTAGLRNRAAEAKHGVMPESW